MTGSEWVNMGVLRGKGEELGVVMLCGRTARAWDTGRDGRQLFGHLVGAAGSQARSDAGGQRASEAARTDVVADQLLQHGAPPCLVRVGADIVAQPVAARPLINGSDRVGDREGQF